MKTHRDLAEELLGATISPEGYAPCPGAHRHTTPTEARHFRIWFDPEGEAMPREHCFHQSCQAERDAFMAALWRAIKAQQRGFGAAGVHRPASLPAAPKPQRPANLALDRARAEALAAQCPVEEVTHDWLRQHSPVRIPEPARQAETMLDALFRPGERILVFTKFASQGQFLRVIGGGNYRLGPQGSRAVPASRLPRGASEGVWYLCAPVTGRWEPNPNKRDAAGHLAAGRRHAACCTRYPYLVLESDVLPPDIWLRILVQLCDPIASIYTSGGKSHHALVRIDAPTKEQFDAARDRILRRLAPVGADPAAMSAVRLTRLPGCLRWGHTNASGKYASYPEPRRQELLYLNPNAGHGPICGR